MITILKQEVCQDLREAMLAVFNTGGSSTASLYAGDIPASPEEGISTQTLLCTLDTSTLFATSISITTANVPSVTAVGTGQGTFVRFYNGAGNAVADCSVSLYVSSGDIVDSAFIALSHEFYWQV